MEPVPAHTDRLYSREEYRRWCEAQPHGRYELVDGYIIAMAPERVRHVRVKAAVHGALERAVAAAGLPCEVFPDGLTVEAGDSDFIPDALVNCGERIPDDEVAAPNPVIVVEVLSPGTASVDTSRKLAGYFRVPSIMHYLIVDPTRRMVIHHRRAGESIETKLVVGGPIEMDPPGLVVAVEDFYQAA